MLKEFGRLMRWLSCLVVWLAVGDHAAAESGRNHVSTERGALVIHPVNHATFAMDWDGQTIYVDPVGGGARFAGLSRPDMVLVTDVHGDHLDPATLAAVVAGDTRIIAPAAVAAKLPPDLRRLATVLGNGEQESLPGLTVEAVPMYNRTEERLQYHPKGRGNGYLLTLADRRVYISGDTEDIAEMRALDDIDVAFVCFNLPYTMTEEQAASAVREFAPDIVYPYHFRGSDVDEFTRLVGEASEVRVLDWY